MGGPIQHLPVGKCNISLISHHPHSPHSTAAAEPLSVTLKVNRVPGVSVCVRNCFTMYSMSKQSGHMLARHCSHAVVLQRKRGCFNFNRVDCDF